MMSAAWNHLYAVVIIWKGVHSYACSTNTAVVQSNLPSWLVLLGWHLYLVPSMHLYWNTSPCITQLVQFIESLKCIVTALTEKTGQPPFVWVFHLITLSPSVRRLGLVKTLETSKLLCSAFTLHGCREEEEGWKKKKRCVLIQLKIMRVEGFSSGALLYWTWRTTCTTSTYTFSNASQHGVRSLDPVKTTPPVCATNVSVAPVSDNV